MKDENLLYIQLKNLPFLCIIKIVNMKNNILKFYKKKTNFKQLKGSQK